MSQVQSHSPAPTVAVDSAGLVSIVIPTYRRRHYLEVALASALAQTYRNLEVIISEDGGLDYSQTVADCTRDARVRVRWNEKNLGIAGNTIAVMREARGQFIVNLSDDDLLCPDFVTRLIDPLIQDPSIVLAFCDHFMIDAKGNTLTDATEANTRRWGRAVLAPGRHEEWLRLAVVDPAVPMAMGAVFRANAVELEHFPLQAGSFWDSYLTYLLCKSGGAMWYEPTRLSQYRVHASQETATGRMRFSQAGLYCYEKFMGDPDLAAYRPQFRRRWIESATNLGIALLIAGSRSEARRQFMQALRRWPNFRSTAGLILTLAPSSLSKRLIGGT
jgi:glycosyltransferase involved in cell wall biosynthesis